MGSDGDPLSPALPHIQSLKSSSAGWCMKRRTGVLISPRSRRRKATAFPSLTFPEIWSSPVTTRAPGNWRPTLCQEAETRSGRCWRRRASAFSHPNHSGEVANVIIELKKIFYCWKFRQMEWKWHWIYDRVMRLESTPPRTCAPYDAPPSNTRKQIMFI